jgi:hypothetical protein
MAPPLNPVPFATGSAASAEAEHSVKRAKVDSEAGAVARALSPAPSESGLSEAPESDTEMVTVESRVSPTGEVCRTSLEISCAQIVC